jgi:hypothetical protein
MKTCLQLQLAFLLLLGTGALTASPMAAGMLFPSTRAAQDIELSSDPSSPFWQAAGSVIADRDPWDHSLPRYRTRILSRWTDKYLYLLFVCPYEELTLKPSPSTSQETFGLWNWDVAEAFIGSDFQNIRQYREFEMSPQAEWVDLAIDLSNPHHEDGWTWNSGFHVAAQIDASAQIWYGAMRIPFAALEQKPAAPGQRFRINLFRSQGPSNRRVQIAWQPTMSKTFHVPERFGLLELENASPRY